MKKLLISILFILLLTPAFAYNITIYTTHQVLHYYNVVSYSNDGRYLKLQMGFEENSKIILIDSWSIVQLEIEQ